MTVNDRKSKYKRTNWRNDDNDANRQIGTKMSVNWTGAMKQVMTKEETALTEADKERKPEKREGGAAASPETRAIHSGIPSRSHE